MGTRFMKACAAGAVLAPVLLVACLDTNLINNPSFDLWCAKQLCGWTTDQGSVERVGTWHTKDYGVSFADTPTQISQVAAGDPVQCMRFDMIADVEPEAQLQLLLDFNDDGIIDHEQLVPSLSWERIEFLVPTPADYVSVRYILRKSGAGKAVLAQVRAVGEEDTCGALRLAEGSYCTTDASCASDLCVNKHCSGCGNVLAAGPNQPDSLFMTCQEGEGCHADAQCAPGLVCTGGVCRSCAADGTCPAFTPCGHGAQCASGACVQRFDPSQVAEPAACLRCEVFSDCGTGSCSEGSCEVCSLNPLGRHCAECLEDADCNGGFCNYGVCSSCRSAEDCGAGEACRFAPGFDAGPRSCTSEPLPALLPRGALCEADTECEGGLACGAPPGEPPRCGIACETATDICGLGNICARPGLSEVSHVIWYPMRTLPAWDGVEGRVATCFPAITAASADRSCSAHAQCELGACCDGECRFESNAHPDLRTGGCWFSEEN